LNWHKLVIDGHHVAYATIGPIVIQIIHRNDGTGLVTYRDTGTPYVARKTTRRAAVATRLGERIADRARREVSDAIDALVRAVETA
jgi:hypothetical protein